MSGENNIIEIATAQVGDGPQPADFQMQHTGSVFQAAPTAAAEGTTKNFRILANGTMFITNDAAVPLVFALPADAATETTLAALNAAFAAEDFATETTLAALNAKIPALGAAVIAASQPVNIASDQVVPVSQTSQPLPTGAATEVTLAALNAAFAAEDFATQATLNAINTKTPSIGQAAKAGSVPVTLATDEDTLNVAQETPVAKTVQQAQITVGTSAVRLVAAAGAPDADRTFLSFRPDPDSVARFFYGSSTVTTANGHEVFAGESIEREFDAADYFIISDTAAQTVHIVEQE